MKLTFGKSLGVLLLLVLLAVAGLLVGAWAPDRRLESLKQRWAPPPSQFVLVDGMQVHVRDEGPQDDPLPVVLLHGTSASLHTWDGWASELKARHRVIRLDMPGFGLTGPHPQGRYDIGSYTRFLRDLFDRMGVKQATVVGNSFGGYVAWKMAVDHPERVARLILVDAGGYAYKAQSVPIGFRLAQIPLLKPVFTSVLPRRMVESSVRNVYGDPGKVTPELVDRYYELTLRAGNREALVGRFAQSKGGEFEAQVASVSQPTLIIWGSEDRLIPPDNAERFHRDIRNSRVMVFDKLGHVPHEEDPATTVAAAQAFIEQP